MPLSDLVRTLNANHRQPIAGINPDGSVQAELGTQIVATAYASNAASPARMTSSAVRLVAAAISFNRVRVVIRTFTVVVSAMLEVYRS